MQPIEIGDLVLADGPENLQSKLFHAVRLKIVGQLWPTAGRLPSTRKMAAELGLSRNTVVAAYEQLVAEGYIESRRGAGFFVAVTLPEQYFNPGDATVGAQDTHRPPGDVNAPFAPGVPDLAQFPLAKWNRCLQRHVGRVNLLGNQPIQGCMELRSALAAYLASSRSVHCHADRIIITSGAQQALAIALMATVPKGESVLMEQPGYTQMTKVLELNSLNLEPLPVRALSGLEIETALQSHARALYVTPSNQYPMGTTLNTEQRLTLIEWARIRKSWIIEDDYDSEFQFAHRPYTSLQGLAAQVGCDERVLYVGSFSKVMFNGLRIGYLVVPASLVESCVAMKDALSGDSPAHTQAALAEFIAAGDLQRHIRKMRRLYKQKHQRVCEAIGRYLPSVSVISQAAGLHVTLKWRNGPDERTVCHRAKQADIILRPLSYYEHDCAELRHWYGAVLGFGNTALDQIEPQIMRLARVFET